MNNLVMEAARVGAVELAAPAPRPFRMNTIFSWELPTISEHNQELLNAVPMPTELIDRPRQQLDDPGLDTRAQQYQDNWHFIDTGYQFIIQPGIVFEVSRFLTGPQRTGIVKNIWTFQQIWETFYLAPIVLDPGNPFSAQQYGAEVRWHLRLYPGPVSSEYWQGSFLDIPGSGYNRLPNWTDNRFSWGQPTPQDVFFIVPSNFSLRLFVEVVAISISVTQAPYLNKIGGRLVGYTQPNDVFAIGQNVRHGWI